MKTVNRKHIRRFLKVLDAFISEFSDAEESRDSLNDTKIGLIFANLIKANAENRKSIGHGEPDLDIPELVKYCNRSFKGYVKGDLSKEFEDRRTDTFVRSVAYGLEWEYVRDLSYLHIFFKRWVGVALDFGYQIPSCVASVMECELMKHSPYLNEFIVPKDWKIGTSILELQIPEDRILEFNLKTSGHR